MACAICKERKEKRFCPALHDRICAVCCGTEREVSLECPSECEYLQQARKNERPREISQAEVAELFPQVEVSHNFVTKREPLLVGLSFGLAKCAQADRSLRDADMIEAMRILARTQVTLARSGLHYQPPAVGAAQQVVAAEMKKMMEEYRQLEQKHLGAVTLQESDVLQAYVFLLRMAFGRSNGRPKSRAFVEFLLAQFPEKPEAGAKASGLIVPAS